MSSDLWAAFGDGNPSSNPWGQQSLGQPSTIDENSISHIESNFSGFDIAPKKHQEPTQSSSGVNDHDSDADSWSAVNQELEDAWTRPSTKPTSTQPPADPWSSSHGDLIDDDDFGEFEAPEAQASSITTTAAPTIPKVDAPLANLLEAEDDFGDFEDAENEAQNAQVPSQIPASIQTTTVKAKSLPIENSQPTAKTPANTGSSTLIDYDPFADLEQLSQPSISRGTTTITSSTGQPKASQPSHITQAPAKAQDIIATDPDPDEEWDDFSEPANTTKGPPPEPKPKQGPASTSLARQGPPIPTSHAPTNPAPSTSDPLPPTNVPPPSVLIPLISTIILDLPSEIDSILHSHSTYEGGQSALTQALHVLSALDDRVSVIKVAARILAGRKLRWKRDTVLAQSMSMGAAGRRSGMKLVGVDKTEVKREDREASEFVRVWAKQQGRMRGALMKLPAQIDEKPPTLPHVAEQMVVRTVTERQGGVRAPKCCVLCGLKREERVEKVDLDVWDQFGEWWTEHWGHTECRTFWNTHEQFLQQR